MNTVKMILCVFFWIAGLGGPAVNLQVPLAWAVEGLQAGDFAPGQLEAHYLKHGYQFGEMTQEEYLQGAQELLDTSPSDDVLERIRPNGDVEHFRVSTGEFAVMTKRGRIRTYFKTDMGYWMREDSGR